MQFFEESRLCSGCIEQAGRDKRVCEWAPAPEDSDAGKKRLLTAGDNVAEAVFGPDRLTVRCLALAFPLVSHLQAVGTHVDDFRVFLAWHVTTDTQELRISGVIVRGEGGRTTPDESKGGDGIDSKRTYPFHEIPPESCCVASARVIGTPVPLGNRPDRA